MVKLAFRLAQEDDLPLLDELRGKKLHKLHLKRIRDKNAQYIIAFEGDRPVGHVFLEFVGEEPKLTDIYVRETDRKKGIGTQLILFAIKEARKRDYAKVGLDVETKEKGLLAYYVSLGFKKVSGPHTSTFVMEDEEVTQVCFHMNKRIQ